MHKLKNLRVGYPLKATDPCVMDETGLPTLTVGEIYTVETICGENFEVIDDDGDIHLFGNDDDTFIELSVMESDEFNKSTEVLKTSVKNIISDMVADFLYYDRKEDDQIGVGDIDKLTRTGKMTVDEMTNVFRNELEKGLK